MAPNSDEREPIARAEDYIRKAEQAEAKAKATTNPQAKMSYLSTAANWRRLAKHLDPALKRAP